MTTNVRTQFDEEKSDFMKFRKELNDLRDRYEEAEKNIVNLQDEQVEIRKIRPEMIANNEDVSTLTKRLTEIDSELELNKDAIKGIGKKIKNLEDDEKYKRGNIENSFKNIVIEELLKLAPKYMKLAKDFSEIVKDYVVMEQLISSCDTFYSELGSHIKEIPNVQNYQNPLYKYDIYYLFNNRIEKVRKKYNLPSIYN